VKAELGVPNGIQGVWQWLLESNAINIHQGKAKIKKLIKLLQFFHRGLLFIVTNQG
jgi:hypothetical protein